MQWQLRVCKAMLIRSSILTGRHIFIYFAFISETSATYCRLCSAVLVLTVALCPEQWIYSQNYNTGRCNLRIYLSKQLLRMGQKSPFTPIFFHLLIKKEFHCILCFVFTKENILESEAWLYTKSNVLLDKRRGLWLLMFSVSVGF